MKSEITPSAFKAILDSAKNHPEYDFVNVCTPPEYAEKHIIGVRNIPLDKLSEHLEEFKTKRKIFLHCRSGNRGKQALDQLEKLGLTSELVHIEGGLNAWEAAGLPVAIDTSRMPLMQQVLLAAGTLVTLGIILALVVDPRFVFLPLFVGCGLMFSGITGWCGMSLLLAKMPWNQA